MNRNIKLLTLILFFISAISNSQTKKIFSENFNDNNKKWLEAKNEHYDFFFRNGKYCIINNVDFFYGENKDIIIDETENFILESSIALNWNTDGFAYFAFGANRTTQNYFYFAFNKDKGYIGKFIDGQHINTSHKISLNKFGVENTIKIIKKDNNITFYFNNKKIIKQPYENLFGNGFGFGASKKQNISIDYLNIYQDETNKENLITYETKKEAVTYEYEDGKSKINLKKENGVYHIPVKLNKVLDINFIFDSGAADVSITPEVALTLIKAGAISENDWLEDAYYQFADGTIAKSKRFNLKTVQVGDKIIKDVTCSISNNLNAPMLLGQSVMEKFGKYTFDYKTNQLIIE